YYRNVEIPDDAIILYDNINDINSFYAVADKLILSKRDYIYNFIGWTDKKYIYNLLNNHGSNYLWIMYQDNIKICMNAIKNNGNNLRFIRNQTNEICLEAVKNNAYAIRFVKNKTPEICM